jgi:hypothetical protein
MRLVLTLVAFQFTFSAFQFFLLALYVIRINQKLFFTIPQFTLLVSYWLNVLLWRQVQLEASLVAISTSVSQWQQEKSSSVDMMQK